MEKRGKKSGKRIDPICGMPGKIPAHGHYFCSHKCIDEYEEKLGIKKSFYHKTWFFYTIIIIIAVALIMALQLSGQMIIFMGSFFIVFSYLKFLDWKGFSQSFAMYDIIAKRSRLYSYAYPLIELAIGIAFIFAWQITITAAVTLLVMSIGTIGVARNLLSKSPVRCACLGTLVSVPLTKFTLVEDLGMAVMALMILAL